MFNISVKFHLNIPHSKGTTGKKHFLIQQGKFDEFISPDEGLFERNM